MSKQIYWSYIFLIWSKARKVTDFCRLIAYYIIWKRLSCFSEITFVIYVYLWWFHSSLIQVMILLVIPKYVGLSSANYAKNLLRATVLLQYVPRIIRFVPLLGGQSTNGFIFESAWSTFVINLLMFVLAGHVVGSCWYLFGLQVSLFFNDNSIWYIAMGAINQILPNHPSLFRLYSERQVCNSPDLEPYILLPISRFCYLFQDFFSFSNYLELSLARWT